MSIITILLALATLYAAACLVYLAFTRFAKRWPPVILALAPFAYWLFLPIIPLPLILSLAAPLTPAYAASLVAALVYLVHFVWPVRLRRPAAELCQNPGPLILVTSNLLKTNRQSEAIVETICALNADVVALQELKPWHAEALTQLQSTYPHQVLDPTDDHRGVAILSKLPLSDVRRHLAQPDANPTLLARVQTRQGAIWMVNMHTRIPRVAKRRLLGLPVPLGADASERRSDILDLIALMETLDGPAVLLGDMNTTPEELDYRLIPKAWRSAFATTGRGFGFSYPIDAPFFGVKLPFPLFQLDHVFLRGDWLVGRTRFGAMPGSDHRYLMAEIELVSEPSSAA